jgi:hypothetical protein
LREKSRVSGDEKTAEAADKVADRARPRASGVLVGLGRFELPTYGLGKQTAILIRFENFGL